VSLRGCRAVVAVECSKLVAQLSVHILLAACIAAPFAFAVAMRVQTSVPADTLFGRAVTESGFAVPLVVLGFAALWAFPVVCSVVGGDLFSAEDRYGTWASLMTTSRSRTEIFVGKAVAALPFSTLAIFVLASSSIAAGVLVVGPDPLIDLSGMLQPAPQALSRVALAWASILPPALAFTAVAILISVATRSSAAGIGIPVLIGLTMQLCTLLDGPEPLRRLSITSAFGAWHGLLTEPSYHGPLLHGAAVSGAYVAISLAIAYRILQRRDIGG
jgi:ABC-2 type transport system permease protein